jgi:signal peptidase I
VTSPFAAPADEAPPPAKPARGRGAFGCLFEVIETLVLTVLIFFVIQNFVAQPYQVKQQSMETTLEPGQYVLVDKLTPRFDSYKRGDVIVFEPPVGWALGEDRTPFIKRIIGMPGDTLELRDGYVYVNGTKLTEPYVYQDPDGQPQPTDPTGGESRWTIPAGELFVMGDHREASADSRTFGPIAESSVIGRAWLRYWPLSTFGLMKAPAYPELSATSDATWGAVLPAGAPRAA